MTEVAISTTCSCTSPFCILVTCSTRSSYLLCLLYQAFKCWPQHVSNLLFFCVLETILHVAWIECNPEQTMRGEIKSLDMVDMRPKTQPTKP